MNALRQGLSNPEAHQFPAIPVSQLSQGTSYASQVVGLQVDATPA